ncbi:Gfo/Idh/MocA family oxidoreductase [Kitasatospora paracochleata]|uniref:Dehydrogenase n=1 Tax=Kitasatospora paracochleata TaxID=58354 RepID=A0ABT1IW62_9ACTN|nr:Gfo/Idh/MocA family oxidoreductase [Kitasatospora paracochleata]MCP2309384.1 putative dehydrogenase [Kitasatospora paracochleata]
MPRTDAQGFVTGRSGAPLDRPLTLAVLGAGARGEAYAHLAAAHPDRARVVAVAEPRERVRTAFADRHHVAPESRYATWRELAARPRLADVAVVCLPDADHLPAATALADLGYQLLLEKPMATTEAGCEQVADAARRSGTALAVAFVLRHTPYTIALKKLITDGAVGDIVSVQHLEPVGHYHFAHSFVRGYWRRESESSFLLMTKSCHDIDWLGHVVGRSVTRVSSFGSLTHFRPDQAPPRAADRCVDCPLEPDCAYSAVRLYREGLRVGGPKEYFTRVVTGGELTEDAVAQALTEGPYGRCVYHADNDVVDHQVVNLEYEGGVTASFTLTAFTPMEDRRTKVFGTRGQLTGDGRHIEVYDFRSERTVRIDTAAAGSVADDHAGGDTGLFDDFVDALRSGETERITTGLDATLASHRVVFAAERARRTGTVVEL